MIHFLSDPSWKGSSVSFEADMGSASVDAFEDFLDVLAGLHIMQVDFGSQSMEAAQRMSKALASVAKGRETHLKLLGRAAGRSHINARKRRDARNGVSG